MPFFERIIVYLIGEKQFQINRYDIETVSIT